MDTLSSTYTKSGVASQVQLQRTLRNMKYQAGDSLNVYILEFEKNVTDLKNASGKIDDIETVSQLLASISEPQYQSVVTAIDILFLQPDANVTLDFVKSKLLAEEQRQKCNLTPEVESSAAFYDNNENKNKKKTAKKKFPFKCYLCGKVGQKKVDCFKNKKESQKANLAEEENQCKNEVSFISCFSDESGTKLNSHNPLKFVADSGCTNHLITEQLGQFLMNKKKVNHSIKVAKGGESVIANYKGTLHLISQNGQRTKLENVFLCKNLTHNLLSVKKMESKGLKIIFRGELEGNLYILNLNLNQTEFCSEANLVKTINEKDLWHKRMGHSSKYPSTSICEVCLEAKQTRKPFKKLSDERKAKNTLECISSDVCGPLNPRSRDGKKYFFSFIDHYSHFSVVYFMQNKSETFQKFREHIAMVENQFQKLPNRLRCDNGGEYISYEMKNYCKQKGIKIKQMFNFSSKYGQNILARTCGNSSLSY